MKSNKNDSADAEAIVEAALRPGMRFVAVKQIWQQDILMVHRVRARLVRQRTALMNEIRGLLQEYGTVFPRGALALRKGLLKWFRDESVEPSGETRNLFFELSEEWRDLDRRIVQTEQRIKRFFKGNEVCCRLEHIDGVGPMTATAMVATVGDPTLFRSGRELAASIGLVPRQHSSGGKTQLRGISKRGDAYLRQLLVHGARNVVRYVANKSDRRSQWVKQKVATRGFNKTCVAIANKNARICWALMRYGASYAS